MATISIKQPKFWASYDLPDWVEPYDRTLVPCECGALCEKGIGTCDPCIDKAVAKMTADLEEICDGNRNDRRTEDDSSSFWHHYFV